MRTRLLNLLLLAALGLAASRLWLFLGEPPPALPVTTAGAPPAAAPAVGSEQPAGTAEFRPELYDVIVARDLFSPTRGIVPPAPAAATKPAPKPQPAPKLTLYGVVILDGEKTAFVQEGNQEGRPRKVRENEQFSGFVVKAIRPDGVTFVYGGSEINVPLRTPKEGAPAPAARGKGGPAAAPRPERPTAAPRRQLPLSSQPGQMPAPGRQVSAPPGMSVVPPEMQSIVPPIEPGVEVFGDEEFPEGVMPGGEMPGMPEEEAGE